MASNALYAVNKGLAMAVRRAVDALMSEGFTQDQAVQIFLSEKFEASN